MAQKNTAIINKLSKGRAELVANCRYLNNSRVAMEYLSAEEISKTNALSAGKHVLVINDTSEINYGSHSNFLKTSDVDLGPTGNNKDIGFFIHPGLVIDTKLGLGIGFSYLKIWNRQWDKKDKKEREYAKQAIEDKESYRWIDCGLKSKEQLRLASSITIVADRESDIFEEFCRVPDHRTNLLIRSSQNRNLIEGDKLYSRLADTVISHEYNLTIRTTKNHIGRTTNVQLKYTKVKIKKPANLSISDNIPQYVEVGVVEVKEDLEHVPSGEKPIHWILLTTHEINNINDALTMVLWYAMRWQIELLFSTLKTAALNIESSQLESGSALKKLCIIALGAALKINQLRQSRNDITEIPANIIFSTEQIQLIKILIPNYQGKTEKQSNPFKENTVAWAAWLIARLGGWKGYARESPPGNKTFKWGLDRFNDAFEGYKLAKEMCA